MGPHRTRSTSGAHYFLTIVDDYSRAVWTLLLFEKSEVSYALQNFFAFIERQFGMRVKTVRSDNGTEFTYEFIFPNKWYNTPDFVFATPQQNGHVERQHRHILNVARDLLFQAHLPVRFLGEGIMAATYLINRTLSVLLKGKTPYELLYDAAPDYAHLRVFGSLCFARRVSRDHDKFQEKSIRRMFLGMSLEIRIG